MDATAATASVHAGNQTFRHASLQDLPSLVLILQWDRLQVYDEYFLGVHRMLLPCDGLIPLLSCTAVLVTVCQAASCTTAPCLLCLSDYADF
jgi:hypothetical protein